MLFRNMCVVLLISLAASPERCSVSCGGAPGDTVLITSGNRYNTHTTLPSSTAIANNQKQQQIHQQHMAAHQQQQQQQQKQQQHSHHHSSSSSSSSSSSGSPTGSSGYHHSSQGSGHKDHRNSYNLLSEAMSQAVSNEFSSLGSGSADGACPADDLDCYSGNIQDRLGMEAIRTLHRQLDDDDNGNIDLSESDDFLREELKYDSGYEKRQKAFHFNDDMHISVKELWEAWLRSEVHNWTIEQTTDWLAQSVQLPQYVELFKAHKVTGAALPRLAVNNMHYVGNVLGIKDPIHKQKIALKAMDVVLFGPPRETGTRWKDYILVTLLLSAIIGCWYAYQQNKNAKRHLRRMAQDMEGLQRAEQSLQEMQKELERARMEQENVATEKLDLERRLKEAPSLSSSSSDLEVQQLKKEIEMLRTELSRAEIELVDNCWSPPPQLQSWLQYTYELESKNHLKKRISAEKQLQCAREACEKLRKKRSSLVGAFVSTHGKSIDDVDRSIVEARNSLGEVTNELQERLHRWKQIETCLGFNIVNNNGLPYLESVLYGRNNGSNKGSRGRMTSSTDDLDDESVQGMVDSYSRNSALGGSSVINSNCFAGGSGGGTTGSGGLGHDDSSASDDVDEKHPVHFYLGSPPTPSSTTIATQRGTHSAHQSNDNLNHVGSSSSSGCGNHRSSPTKSSPSSPAVLAIAAVTPTVSSAASTTATLSTPVAMQQNFITDSMHIIIDDNRHSPSVSSERSIPIPPRSKKSPHTPALPPPPSGPIGGRAPLPPPRRSNQSHIMRSQSADLVPMELYSYQSRQQQQSTTKGSIGQHHNLPISATGTMSSTAFSSPLSPVAMPVLPLPTTTITTTTTTAIGQIKIGHSKMVKQHSTASQQSSSSTSSIHSAPPSAGTTTVIGTTTSNAPKWSSNDRINRATNDRIFRSMVARSGGGSEREPLIESTNNGNHYASGVPTVAPTKSIGQMSFGMQSLYNLTTGRSVNSNQDCSIDDTTANLTDLTDSSSLDGELKKRRRRLRFPFGKKSNKTKLT